MTMTTPRLRDCRDARKRRALQAAALFMASVLLAVSAQAAGTAANAAAKPSSSKAAPRVVLETTRGAITIELDADKAPLSVANFLDYVERKHYDGLVFHRVIPGFMIQAGGYDRDLNLREPGQPIRNEGGNGLRNVRGSVAMARRNDPHSATAQFFINLVDNPTLDAMRYAVFGTVVEGMDVVDAIAQSPTTTRNDMENVPETAVVIERATKRQPPKP